MFIYVLCYSMLLNVIDMPFDKGANKQGSSQAYKALKPDLKNLKINKIHNIENCDNNHYRNILGDGFMACWDILNSNDFPLLIGGDHSCVISSIFAANEYCINNKETLGVLWFDAHTDFNTMETSPSGNIHGVPVSVLCGHTLPLLSFGQYLEPSQFLYYGIRDIDSLEFIRFQEFNMNSIDYNSLIDFQLFKLQKWMSNYDKIHLSFDMDCFDSKDFDCVNTPVSNGPKYEDIMTLIKYIKNSNKLMSMDLVEYNPTIKKNNTLINELLTNIFLDES